MSYYAAWFQCYLHLRIATSCAAILCCMVSVFSTHKDCCQLSCHIEQYGLSVLYTKDCYQLCCHTVMHGLVFSTHIECCQLSCHTVLYGFSVLYTYGLPSAVLSYCAALLHVPYTHGLLSAVLSYCAAWSCVLYTYGFVG